MKRQRIDLPAVLEHFEVHVGSGRAARGAHEGQRIAAGNRAAHADRQALIVAVARDQPVAMADLDEVAVTGLLAGERDDARGYRDDVRALGAGEIDALVERLVTRERILALTEIRGDVAFAHRAAVGADLLIQLLRQQRVFQRRELRVA